MTADISRRRLLQGAAAVLPVGMAGLRATPAAAQTAPSVVDVKARPIESFDPRDPSHVRYGALEFRSGLVLTSSFRGFGGLSGLRLDKKGEIHVQIVAPELRVEGDTAAVSFEQRYRAGALVDTGRKRMAWHREGGEWMIRREGMQ